ncbi:hypothetical protein C1879_08895 [Paraeggerthella hongkongensis]|nr:hypothetical protein C1879_08895 [Paraeggerthella hongkongensis]
MPSEHVRNLFNASNERHEVVVGVLHSVARRGRIAVVVACYTVWIIACCTGPSLDVGGGLPSWLGPLFIMAVASAIIAAWFKRTRKVPDSSSWMIMLAFTMTLAAVVHLVWALDRALPFTADVSLYVSSSVLTGVGAALFRVEIDRVFGWVGTQQTLYQGMVGTVLAAAVLVTCFSIASEGREPEVGPVVLYGMALALPFVMMLLLKRIVCGFPRIRYRDHGRDVALPFPAKFVATSAVQGVAAGVLYMSLFVLAAAPALGSVDIVVGQMVAVVLLFATLVFLRLDFNRFIYKVAFTFVAIGFLLLALVPEQPAFGVVVLAAGFCYLDLVLWSLGACLMKNMGLPATWVASCPGAALFFGAVAGGLATSIFLSGRPLPDAAMLASFVACFLFASALFLSSGSNLKYGWGTVLPGEGGFEEGSLADVVRFTATERNVTQRESEVMLLLVEGKTRRAICEELTVSPDTVKTHVRAVYRKVGVHSQQELIDRMVAERERILDGADEVTLG